jgi:hypothetical protein
VAKTTVQHEPCKRKHHRWFEGTDPNWTPSWGLAGEVEICDNCGTVRRRGVNNLGEVITTQYIWPEGYRESADTKPSKQELRAAWYARQPVAKQKPQRRLRSVS